MIKPGALADRAILRRVATALRALGHTVRDDGSEGIRVVVRDRWSGETTIARYEVCGGQLAFHLEPGGELYRGALESVAERCA